MRTMGLTYNQGGILNFLGKQPEVTAPIRAQSHADSPPTQLAYITDAEKDLLVKSNIHGSMEGGPNPGPAGLESLDDWFITSSGDVGGGSGAAVSAWESAGMPDTGYSGSEGDYTPSTLPSGQAVAVNVVQTPEGPKIEGPQTVVGVPGGSFLDGQVVPPPTVDEEPPPDDASSSLWNDYAKGNLGVAAAKGLFGWVKYPKAKQFTMYGNQNDLAIIKSLLLNAEGELDPTKVDIYYEKYKDIINEGLKTDMKEVEEERGGTTSDEFWDKKFEEQGNLYFKKALASAPDKGAQGEESQRRLDKVSFYEDQISPQTKGGLEKLAGETIITGGNLSPEEKAFNQKVFNARNELDRQWGDQGGQGGGGIPSSGGVTNLLPNLIEDNLLFPPQTGENVYGLPDAYSGFYDSEFYNPNVPSGQVIVPVTLPDGTVVNMPNSAAGSQFQQYLDSLTTTPAATTTPTPFDYSQWPQFGPAGGPVPNYVNQGLGQWPQFNYWNQIANAFPGMS